MIPASNDGEMWQGQAGSFSVGKNETRVLMEYFLQIRCELIYNVVFVPNRFTNPVKGMSQTGYML